MARKRSAKKNTTKGGGRLPAKNATAAPTKNTSGAGFSFETCVVAASLLDLLTEQFLDGVPNSRLDVVSAQKGPANWSCDDLLLTYATTHDDQVLVPTSIKSFPALEIVANREEFIGHAWADALGERRRPRALRLGHDRIGLFSTFHSRKLARTLAELIKKAREQGSDFRQNVVAPGHLADGEAWLSRLACPPTVASGLSDAEQQAFIASLERREFDFGTPSSQSYRQYENTSRLATTSESHDDGRLLWQELCRVAEKLREAGGDMSRPRLIQELGSAPRLKDAPRFADTWRRLTGACERELSQLPRTIGRRVSLERSSEVSRLSTLATSSEGRALVICGPSGSGKSTAAGLLCSEVAKRGRVLWMSLPLAIKLAEKSNADVLSHGDALGDVLASVSCPEAWLFIDGLDRATRKEHFSGPAAIISAARLNVATRWTIVATCQHEHWPRVRRLLTDAGVDTDGWSVTVIEALSAAELTQVTSQVPAILPVLNQPRLRRFASRPLILDLLVKAAENGDLPDQKWIGESHLVEWFWETRVRASVGISGSQTLLELGRRQADAAELDTAIFDVSSQTDTEPLLKAGLLREREERVGFDHDTLGDWARFRWLLANGAALPKVLQERSNNPLWHSAIRLLAIHRLEKFENSDQWEALIDSCEAVTDFALDAVIFAADSQNLLKRVSNRLFAEEAKLAKRLIRRAIIVCTDADHSLLKRASQLESPTPFLRTISRDPRPYYFFYGPLLQFCRKESTRLAETAAKEGAELSKVWLQMTPGDWPYRDDAAEIALTIAERTWADRQEYRRSVEDEDAKIIYQAGLAALREQPIRAKQFFLKTCFLEPASSLDPDSSNHTRSRGLSPSQNTRRRKLRSAVSWPDGPGDDVDEAFREACSERDGMDCLFRHDPVLAERILLALTIEVRRREDRESSVDHDSTFGLIRPSSGFAAPHYHQGPFLAFLQTSRREAVSLILKIVNFASERAAAAIKRKWPKQTNGIPSPVGNGVLWAGDESVFCWNRARIDACARAVAPLAALEKWLGDNFANGVPIDEELTQILKSAKSVAIAGVLLDLGRRFPELFDGPLRPLIQSPILLIWAEMQSHESQTPLLGGPETHWGQWFFDEHKAWLFASYRKRSIVNEVERLSAAPDVRWEELKATPFEPANILTPEEGLQLIRRFGAVASHQWMLPKGSSQLIAQQEVAPSVKRRKPTPRERAAANAKQWFRALIDNSRFKEHALAELRNDLSVLQEIPAGTSSALNILKRQAQLGQVTFMLVRYEEWLKANGLWDIYIDYAIEQTSDVSLFFSSARVDAVRDLDWRSFLAPVAISVWRSDVDRMRLKSWIAHLAVFASGGAKCELVELVFAHRKELGDYCLRVVHLILRSAAVWWEIEFRRQQGEPEFDVAVWWSVQLNDFVSGKLPPEIPALTSLYLRDPPLRYAQWRRDNRRGSDEDVFFRYTPLNEYNVLAAVLNGTPLAALAESDIEARERAAIVHLVLGVELAHLVAYDKSGNKLDIPCDTHPMMGQRNVLDRIKEEILKADGSSMVDTLWEPILALGTTAPAWVEYLIDKWMWPILALPELPRHFEPTWQKMIRFATNHENWRVTSGPRADAYELWSKLLGVDRFCYSYWRKDHVEVIDRTAPLIQTKISELAAWPATAGPLLRWISRGPGQQFIHTALQSIHSNLGRFHYEENDDDQLVNAVAEFLDVAWRVRYQDSNTDRSQLESFRAVLRHAAAAGNSLAIDLEQRASGLG